MENILITFLSPAKASNGKVNETSYTNVDGEPVKTTNESAIRYLLQNGDLSKIFILASKSVRNDKIQGYRDDEGNEVTHLEYFLRRMKKFLTNLDTCITNETIYNYDEDNNGEQNLKSVAEIAERIQNYSRGKNICLHADLTGGMRHINMMMLDVIRLLEYSGVTIGKLIYSNFTTKRVEEVKNIYDLFQLIAGVEEFVNFGSVAALKKYYAANADKVPLSDGLKKLIAAMESFAEAIKLCRYGNFKDSVIELHDAINDFSPNPQNIHDAFMARLIEKIREKYSMLIATRGEDDLKIIRWCIANGYFQQALTLYTERVPEYLGEKFVTQSDDESEKLERKLKGDKRNRYFYLLVEYLNKDDENIERLRIASGNCTAKKNKIYFNSIKNNAVNAIKSKKFNYNSWRKDFFSSIKDLPLFIEPDDISLDEITLRAQLELLDKIFKEPPILLDLESASLKPLEKIIDALKPKLLEKSSGFERRKIIFNSFNNFKPEDIFPPIKVDSRIPRLRYMLSVNTFSVEKIDEEKFLSIMRKYFMVKDERNHSNHAHAEVGNFATAEELENYMLAGIDEIEKALV